MDDLETVVVADPDPASLEGIVALVDEVAAVLGHPALSEHKAMELHHRSSAGGEPSSEEDGPLAVVTRSAGEPGPVGYGHLSVDRPSRQFAVELVVAGPAGRRTAGG